MLASTAVAADAAQLNYSIYVLGLPVADAVLRVDMAATTYQVTLRFHTTGIADVFAGDRLEEHSAGLFDDGQPEPRDYVSNGRLHGRDRLVTMTWHDGVPTIGAITPPNAAEREDVPAALLGHTMDPLDAIVFLLHQVDRNGRCEGSARAYDGRRLQALDAHTDGEEDIGPSGRSSFAGHTLRCQFTDRTLAGFRTGAGRDEDTRVHRGTIWLARILPGAQQLPVRASVETRWLGDAMIYLTSVAP